TLDKHELKFECVKHTQQLKDSLWCDYVFRAAWKPAADRSHQFSFREGNFLLGTGQIDVSLAGDQPIDILERTEAEAALKARKPLDLKPGDTDRLREVLASFRFTGQTAPPSVAPETKPSPPVAEPAPPAEAPRPDSRYHSTLLALLLDSQRGFLVLL